MLFTIVTDSSCNLPDERIRDYELEILSLTYRVGDTDFISYTKDRPTDLKLFYEMLRSKARVTTSLVSPELCRVTFERLLEAGQDILYIGFSSGLSGTYQVAATELAELAPRYPERKCFAVDTLAASLGEGLLVHYAAKMRKLGKSIEETRDWLLENRLHLAHWFTVDDLFFLQRGGRLSATTALLGSLIGIKPVMHMDNAGLLIPMEKVRGRKTAVDRLCQHLVDSAIDPADQIVFISHGDCEADANHLADMIRERTGVREFVINYVDAVIGAHSGPGTLALFFLAKQR